LSWRRFTYQTFLFLIPVLLIVIGIEVLVRNIPSGIKVASAYMKEEQGDINTLILGASQNKRAINPEFLTDKALSVAGTRQGYKTDYYLLHDIHPQLPKLKRIVISSTYRHFESSPNPKNFWKYRSHLYYLDVNAFERTTYFKDKLLFLGSPDFYSDQLESYYLKKEQPLYNIHGFQLNTDKTRFARLGYDEQKINATYIANYPPLDKKYLENSSKWFERILAYCMERELEVIISLTPVYGNFKEAIAPEVIQRRDSILKNALNKYPEVRVFNQEDSKEGAEKFTKKLDAFLKRD